jgi:hypothetical protein
MQSLEEKHVCFIQSAHEVVGDPFVDTKENEESEVSNLAKRRATILAHQTMGKIAGVVGTAMIVDAAKPQTMGRVYTSLQKSQVKAKGMKPSKNVVYFPERGPMTQIRAERKHFNRMYGKRVTKGPKKGMVLRGDELRYYGRNTRKAKVGAALVSYSKIAKFTGYGHAYGIYPRGLATPWDYVVYPELVEQDARSLAANAKRSHDRVTPKIADYTMAYAMGGNEGVAMYAASQVLKGVFS